MCKWKLFYKQPTGHAIGLWHEHSRPDRDQYIDIHHDNLPRNEYHNFDLIKKDVFEQVPDVGYDIQSVMHYGPYTFTNNGNKTITIKEDAKLPELNCTNTLPMGQREQLSYKDKKRASLLYNCDCKYILVNWWVFCGILAYLLFTYFLHTCTSVYTSMFLLKNKAPICRSEDVISISHQWLHANELTHKIIIINNATIFL